MSKNRCISAMMPDRLEISIEYQVVLDVILLNGRIRAPESISAVLVISIEFQVVGDVLLLKGLIRVPGSISALMFW